MMAVPRLRWKRAARGGSFPPERRLKGRPKPREETHARRTTTTPYAALLLRVSLGVMFLAHGAVLKLGTFGLAGTMGYFGSLGYPPAFGAIVTFAEILGGLALVAGV